MFVAAFVAHVVKSVSSGLLKSWCEEDAPTLFCGTHELKIFTIPRSEALFSLTRKRYILDAECISSYRGNAAVC